MSNIKLVRGDNRPFIFLTLTDASGNAIDVSTAAVVVYFRAAGSTTVLSTLTCTNVSTGTDGNVKFNFPTTTLNVPAGSYEGEIEITFSGGDKQTVYSILKFTVREQFQ